MLNYNCSFKYKTSKNVHIGIAVQPYYNCLKQFIFLSCYIYKILPTDRNYNRFNIENTKLSFIDVRSTTYHTFKTQHAISFIYYVNSKLIFFYVLYVFAMFKRSRLPELVKQIFESGCKILNKKRIPDTCNCPRKEKCYNKFHF